MADFYTCKFCGAPLEITAGQKIVTCPYCDKENVLPKTGFAAMNRANQLRLRREYDQAEAIYRSLTVPFPDDAEIWWNILLCEYGIEYVEEAHRRVPTLNRMKYESVMEQDAYKKAIALADADTQKIYEEEARTIEDILIRLQKIVAQEEKYDVFICFKDRDDATGERTLDSALAQEIYDSLTKEGYKVFFSRITLRTAVGQEFEPKIFAALNSAPLMIVVACAPEHVNADWVKNEWSRYLKLMDKDAGKFLLPVYADMKPEDLPPKLADLEGIEINGANYMNLILKNVGDRIGRKKEERIEEQIHQDFALIELDEARRLTERGYTAYRNGRVDNADAYFEQALDINVNYADAWWGKLTIATRDFAPDCEFEGDEDITRYYNQAMQCASEKEKAKFDADMARYEENKRQYNAKLLMDQFNEKTNHTRTVFSGENNATHRSLLMLEAQILDLLLGKEKEEMQAKFDAYNLKQRRVTELKAEYRLVEEVNEQEQKRVESHQEKDRQYSYTLRMAKQVYPVRLKWFLTFLFLPYSLIMLIFVFKAYRNRNSYCGGSVSKLKADLEANSVHLANAQAAAQKRADALPGIYADLKERYSDVSGYVLPKDLNAHANSWKQKLGAH